MTQSIYLSPDKQSLFARANLSPCHTLALRASVLALAGFGLVSPLQAATLSAPSGATPAKMVLNNVVLNVGTSISSLSATLVAEGNAALSVGQIYKLDPVFGSASGLQDAQYTAIDNKVFIPALKDASNAYAVTLAVTQTSPSFQMQVIGIKVTPINANATQPQVQFITGTKGLAGSPGAIGAKGANGDAGPKGLTGDAGPKGLKGDVAGPKGLAGDVGPKGPTGDAGTKGEAGAQGPVGLKGPAGDAGGTDQVVMRGPTGLTGPMGTVISGNATGQLRYWNNNAWQLLNIGTANAKLKVCGGVPTWGYSVGGTGPSGGVVFQLNDACGTTGVEISRSNVTAGITPSDPNGPIANGTTLYPLTNWTDAGPAAAGVGTGWRLPTKVELQTLLGVIQPPDLPAPATPPTYNTPPTQLQAVFRTIGLPEIIAGGLEYGAFWTSDLDPLNINQAYYGDDFTLSTSLTSSITNVAGLVRPVKSF